MLDRHQPSLDVRDGRKVACRNDRCPNTCSDPGKSLPEATGIPGAGFRLVPMEFRLIGRFPPYVFAVVNDPKAAPRRAGAYVIDLGMHNPDIPTPTPVLAQLLQPTKHP